MVWNQLQCRWFKVLHIHSSELDFEAKRVEETHVFLTQNSWIMQNSSKGMYNRSAPHYLKVVKTSKLWCHSDDDLLLNLLFIIKYNPNPNPKFTALNPHQKWHHSCHEWQCGMDLSWPNQLHVIFSSQKLKAMQSDK